MEDIKHQIGYGGLVRLPHQIMYVAGLDEHSNVSIENEGDSIVIRKLGRQCCMCGGRNVLIKFKKKEICAHCLMELRRFASK